MVITGKKSCERLQDWSSILSLTAMVSVKVIALNLTPFKEQRIVSSPTIKKVNVKFPSSHETMTLFKMAVICIAVCQVQIYNDF